MTDDLQKKVDFAIRLLQGAEKMAEKVGQPVEVQYSGGKDSEVILELAKMSGIKFRAIYKNTTIDPPGTIKHALDNGCEVRRPSMSFREVIEKAGFPSRWRRICCEKLKEYKILDYAVVGVRREESIKRAQRYKEPEMCRVYSKSVKARHYLPLLEWTSQDVADFISERGIQCHPLYYDEGATFTPNVGWAAWAVRLPRNRSAYKSSATTQDLFVCGFVQGRSTSIHTLTIALPNTTTTFTNGWQCRYFAIPSMSSKKSLVPICSTAKWTARNISKTILILI